MAEHVMAHRAMTCLFSFVKKMYFFFMFLPKIMMFSHLLVNFIRKYGGSCSIKNRVASATAQKNEGHSWLSKVINHFQCSCSSIPVWCFFLIVECFFQLSTFQCNMYKSLRKPHAICGDILASVHLFWKLHLKKVCFILRTSFMANMGLNCGISLIFHFLHVPYFPRLLHQH